MEHPRVAVIGCGRHATNAVFPSLRFTHLDLVAACDLREEAARACAKRFGAQRFVTDYHELLDPEATEGVIVVVHAALHAQIASEALQAGLHVYTEKPPAMTAEAALGVAHASRSCGRVCMTGFKKRYAPAYQAARKVIREEMQAGCRHLELSYNLSHYGPGETDLARTFLLDAGIHAIDLVRYLMGEVVELVTFSSGSDGQEAYAVALRFEDGSAGALNLSARGTPGRAHETLKVTGNQITVLVDNVVNLTVHRHDGPSQVVGPAFAASGNWTEVTTGLAGELQAFEGLLRDGAEPVSTIASSYRTMVLYEAIRDSRGAIVRPQYDTI